LAKGGNKITFLGRERDVSIGAGGSAVLEERPRKQKERLEQVRREVQKVQKGQGILSLVR